MAVLSSQSPLFSADCREAWKNGLGLLTGAWQQLPGLAEFASRWAVMIPWIPAERSIRFRQSKAFAHADPAADKPPSFSDSKENRYNIPTI